MTSRNISADSFSFPPVRRRLALWALAVGCCLGVFSDPARAQVQFPDASAYTLALNDPAESSCKNNANRDMRKVYYFDDSENERIFVKYEMTGLAGWEKAGQGMYKWGIETGGDVASTNPSGTQIRDEEFFLYVWDGDVEDKRGEVNLSWTGPDGAQSGFPAVIGPLTSCGSDCIGTGPTTLGGEQIANNNPDIGFWLHGNLVEMYVSYAALSAHGGDPVTGIEDLCFIMTGEGTATNRNLDQTNFCDNTANATGADFSSGAVCGSAPGTLTIVKDTVPDDGEAEFGFDVQGASSRNATLQDPGAADCEDPNDWQPCGGAIWDHEDNVTYTDLRGTNHPFQTRTPYQIVESATGANTLEAYDVEWECRNVNPETCSPEDVALVDDPFTLIPGCDPVDPPVRCESTDWNGGVLTGTGPVTDPFDLCMGAHVVCKYTNINKACVALDFAIGDLKAIGGIVGEPAGFATASVPLRTADAEDSLLLASFIPLADGNSRWPGMLDHFILPLPLTPNDLGQLVPDSSATCDATGEDTGCAAWSAGAVILSQAPVDASSGRRIGLADNQRRVTYSQHTGSGVPRAMRAFEWSDSDDLADEYDLWDGFNIFYERGNLTSEDDARVLARATINETLEIQQATIVDDDAPEGTSEIDFVLGDFFHADPVVVAAPANFFYLANDLEGNGAVCDDSATPPNKGYRCFWEKNVKRRRVAIAASNDGQVHAFDAGQFERDLAVTDRLEGRFTYGTGKELFAHVPRQMMTHTQRMTANEHHFGVDGKLVVDDVFIDPLHDTEGPTVAEREWRTVVVGTYREGQRGLFALDVTQPDEIAMVENVVDFSGNPDIAWMPSESAGTVPECATLDGSPRAGCGTLSYPALLWEFDDKCPAASSSGAPSSDLSCDDQLWDFDEECLAVGSTGSQSFAIACDEDSNGKGDLGYSWSQVNTGRILVKVDGVDVVKFVAVFGGGLDPTDKVGIGNWIYMVDVETGKAIYKRPVASAVPSEPAAVDTDQDGFLDTLYLGTTGGLLYKVDMSAPAVVDGTGRISNPAEWEPFPIFDTGGRPIFFPPTVGFVANLGSYALAFGTGDREDLFSVEGASDTGRFYLIVDPGFQVGEGLIENGPLTESSFTPIDALLDEGVTGDFLAAPLSGKQPGWVLQLAANERVVTKALLLSGLLVFTTFHPLTPDVCEFSGTGSVYALQATNANSIAGPLEDRAITNEGMFGQAVITPTGMATASTSGETIDPFEAARIQGIRDNLMDLFPADCRFGSFSLNVSVALSNTSVLPVASVPICVARKNWTEHF